MNRTKYFNYIEEKLGTLAYRINLKGKLNILDLHNHSENFYVDLLNCIYGYDLSNANKIKQNVEAIDLIDTTNKYVLQVSATNTKTKVDGALSKPILKKYSGYTFKFVSISKECSDLRKEAFTLPAGIAFNPKDDIIDNKTLTDYILMKSIDDQKRVYELVRKELGSELDLVKLDSNLAVIINVLSKDNFNAQVSTVTNSFEIDRKIDFNTLSTTRKMIEDHSVYYTKVDKKYSDFDTLGANKSVSVLMAIHKCYVEALTNNPHASSDTIFLNVIESVSNKVIDSANFSEIPLDELELCVSILVVDAFIRCKIFKNPENYQYATA